MSGSTRTRLVHSQTKDQIIQRCNAGSYGKILLVSPLTVAAWSEDHLDSGEYWHRQYAIRHERHLRGQNGRQSFGISSSRLNQVQWCWQAHSDCHQGWRQANCKLFPSYDAYILSLQCIRCTVSSQWTQIQKSWSQRLSVSWTFSTQGRSLDIQVTPYELGQWWNHRRDHHKRRLVSQTPFHEVGACLEAYPI